MSKGNSDVKLTAGELSTLFYFATAQTHFMFNNNYYDQIDE